ncbi:polysaccharide deacetylase family protein [Nannocystis sp. SCPEA4]|uniref:polysaccharide deacetylase family protein n=1 Tax=Nannocystis sp. SCPEA4 TaxID=2996787 RepID=UPI00226FA63D|nr:polysaccharide deacetylase family protein [Nannocystis sp. SCPEA4]MCY1055955.1 polysaccharide deacetylase family protein [Nannocystis sp. SCPEA4]
MTTELRGTILSVDLDDLACYHAIHGLPPPTPEQADVVLGRCLPRLLKLFAETGARATFFVVGRDLERDMQGPGHGAALLELAAQSGHELANHSYSHAYDLVDWPSGQIYRDLRRCDDLLRKLGAQPKGFRAPGYCHDELLLQQAGALGYRYDSSLLPSLPYYAAKLAAMAWIRVRGRRSQSRARGLRSFLGSARPYYRSDVGMWEVPISVSPLLRLPMVGTFVLRGGPLYQEALRTPALHLELHALDLADPDIDPIDPALRKRQPELRTPLDKRLARLRELIKRRGGATSIAAAFGS